MLIPFLPADSHPFSLPSPLTHILQVVRIVQMLLETRKVDVNATCDIVAGHQGGGDHGSTALHNLLGSGGGWDAEDRLACLKLLLRKGADPNLVSLSSWNDHGHLSCVGQPRCSEGWLRWLPWSFWSLNSNLRQYLAFAVGPPTVLTRGVP